MPSYSNIFQPETSFRTQIVDLENEDKKSAWLPSLSQAFKRKIHTKMQDEGLSSYFQTPCVRCFAIISPPEVASSSWQLNPQTEPHQKNHHVANSEIRHVVDKEK